MKIPFDFYEKVFISFFVIVLALTLGAIFTDMIPTYVFEAWTQMLYVVIPTTAGYEGFKLREGRRVKENGTKTGNQDVQSRI